MLHEQLTNTAKQDLMAHLYFSVIHVQDDEQEKRNGVR